MNEGKLLKFLISIFTVLQVLSFIFQSSIFLLFSKISLFVLVTLLYIRTSKKIKTLHLFVLLVFFVSEFMMSISDEFTIKHKMLLSILGYILLFYFLYYNHKSFRYNKRDVFTLGLGSSLYTVIFFITYSVIRVPMGDLYLIGFLHMLLLCRSDALYQY